MNTLFTEQKLNKLGLSYVGSASHFYKCKWPTYKLEEADDKIYFYLCKVDNFNPSEVASADWER